MADVNSYLADLQQEVISRAELTDAEAFQEQAFVQVMLGQLADAGELDDGIVCLHRSQGLQVSGYAQSVDGESLDLIVAIHTNQLPPKTVGKSEMQDAFRRVTRFFDQSARGYFKSIEEATVTFDLAQSIYVDWRSYSRIRFLLVTDGVCKSPPPPPRRIEGLEAVYDIWDAERFYRNWSSGREREEIEVDFTELIGHSIPCLAMESSEGGYSSLLAIFPGSLLVELYGRFGSRLLERNVRSFLQVRGAVNKGIRETIRREPSMFLAYNNGLSCTAAAVELEKDSAGSIAIRRLTDLQIVNGGQTTASIYHSAIKDKADVSGVGVQVKLTILQDASRMDEVVPLVSKYANSQNKVQTADLMANDKFHRRVEELSRTVWAPASEGSLRQSRWFYERARGQYRDGITMEPTAARKKDFERTHPKSQMFTKTDLAKYTLTWEMKPHIVSKGAQYAFSAFTVGIEGHIKDEGQVDVAYFERLVAKAILFRSTEWIVRDEKYPGYRANIVTYSIAKLLHLANGRIDVGRIWNEQRLYPELQAALIRIARACYDHIVGSAAGGNVTQYCKREECWTSFCDLYVSLPDVTSKGFSSAKQNESNYSKPMSHATVVGREQDEDVRKVVEIGSTSWLLVARFGTESRLFTPKQLEVITSVALTLGEGKYPAKKSAVIALSLLKQAMHHGLELSPK